DARLGVRALLEALAPRLRKRASREAEFQDLKARARREFEVVQPQLAFLDAIRAVLPRDGFFVEEISQVGFTARFGFPVYEPRTYVASGYQDNLGFGYMTSLGVKVANPTRAVVSVNGDGGFMFGVQELATAVQHRIGSVAIVFNNQSFGNVLRDQKTTFGGRLLGEALRNPDFVKLAESFGAAGYRAATAGQLRSALERALADDAPALIEVPGEPGAEASPWPFIHRGKAVTPGFINMLAHPEESLIADGRALSDLRQGVTLEVLGEDSMGPLTPEMKRHARERQADIHYTVDWTTLGEYLHKLERHGI